MNNDAQICKDISVKLTVGSKGGPEEDRNKPSYCTTFTPRHVTTPFGVSLIEGQTMVLTSEQARFLFNPETFDLCHVKIEFYFHGILFAAKKANADLGEWMPRMNFCPII